MHLSFRIPLQNNCCLKTGKEVFIAKGTLNLRLMKEVRVSEEHQLGNWARWLPLQIFSRTDMTQQKEAGQKQCRALSLAEPTVAHSEPILPCKDIIAQLRRPADLAVRC